MTPSEPTGHAFSLLHPKLQQRLHDMRWQSLNDIQAQSIPLLVKPTCDVLISAGTASGKTEAAFLGLLSHLLDEPSAAPGVDVLYVAPTVALINDQHDRLTALCAACELVVTKWHGTAPVGPKNRLLKHPAGIVQITPESLEAFFVRRGTDEVARVFGSLRCIVIDELHAFLGIERGAQLASQLHRLDQALGRRIPRVGLSATLGDLRSAASALSPRDPESVQVIVSDAQDKELSTAVHGYLERAGSDESWDDSRNPGTDGVDSGASAIQQICIRLFELMQLGDHLIFANSRRRVEEVADLLIRMAADRGLRNQFHAHHSNVSADLREHAEKELKSQEKFAVAVATSTLEMGVDLPGVATVAQIGPPPSVAALGQRAGRSGRRGGPRDVRLHCAEVEVTPLTGLAGQLREGLTQSIAMTELLQERWCEPLTASLLHSSTLVQQLLSLIAERGGVRPAAAYELLCAPDSPFTSTSKERFVRLLRSLAREEVIVQVDKLLLLAPRGEQQVATRDFFAVFPTPSEYRLRHGSQQIGSIPLDRPMPVDTVLIFAGRRWRVTAISHRRKVIDLVPSPGGRPPTFAGDTPVVHDVVRARMRTVLAGTYNPGFLDATATSLLIEARGNFAAYQLATRCLIPREDTTTLLPWVGNRTNYTLALLLRSVGINCTDDGLVITCRASAIDVVAAMNELVSGEAADPLDLATPIRGKAANKYDAWLSNDLLSEDYARRALDVPTAYDVLWRLLAEASEMHLR